MRGLLRRLLGRGRGSTRAAPAPPTDPQPDAEEQIEAARQRLKATIPQPEDGTPPAGGAHEPTP